MKWKVCDECNNIISEEQNECPFCGYNFDCRFEKEKEINSEEEIRRKNIIKNTLKQSNISFGLKETILNDINTMKIYDENDLNREITKIKLIEYVKDLEYGYVYRRDLIKMIQENKILDKKDINKGISIIRAKYAVKNNGQTSSKSKKTKYSNSNYGIGSYRKYSSYSRGWER